MIALISLLLCTNPYICVRRSQASFSFVILFSVSVLKTLRHPILACGLSSSSHSHHFEKENKILEWWSFTGNFYPKYSQYLPEFLTVTEIIRSSSESEGFMWGLSVVACQVFHLPWLLGQALSLPGCLGVVLTVMICRDRQTHEGYKWTQLLLEYSASLRIDDKIFWRAQRWT